MRLRRRLMLPAVVGVTVLVAVGGLALRFGWTLATDWAGYRESAGKRQELALAIRSEMGYGGAIHSLKNHVLRGEDRYAERFHASHARLLALLDQYRALDDLTPAEREDLAALEQMLDRYGAAMRTSIETVLVAGDADDTQERRRILERIVREVGYGGMIHAFKNYVLRGDAGSREAVLASATRVGTLSDRYQGFAGVSPQELAALAELRSAVDHYRDAVELVTARKGDGATIGEIDAAVRLDDRPALDALAILEAALSDDEGLRATIDARIRIDDGPYLDALASLTATADGLVDRRTRQLGHSILALEWTLATTIPIAAMITLWLTWVAAGRVVGRVRAVADRASGIAAKDYGDDELSLGGEADEITDLIAAVNGMRNALIAHDEDSQAKLMRAQERLQLAVRSAGIGLWDRNLETGRAWASDTYNEMLGYPDGTLDGGRDTWLELIHPDDVDAAVGALDQHLTGQVDTFVTEHRLRRADGSWAWIRSVGEVVERDERGIARRITGVNIDVQSLRDAVSRAEAASRSKSEFLANMSHEIRTPMTAILGFTDVIVAESGDTPGQDSLRDAASTIKRNGRHLLELINDILDLSKIESGRIEADVQAVDPRELVRDVALLMDGRARGKGVELAVECDGELPVEIRTDALRLRQILTNLVGNAIKFTEVGRVAIRMSAVRGSEAGAPATMRFEVVDTGIGMNAEQCSRVFEAFEQADVSTTRQFGGTGLGLAISRRLAGLLGGTLEVRSVEGEGSTFTLAVGAGSLDGVAWTRDGVDLNHTADATVRSESKPAPQPAASAAEPGLKPLEGVRILLVEDGPDNRRLIGHHLRRAGATVDEAEDGVEGVDTAIGAWRSESRHDLVLTDMQMPRKDGMTLTRELLDADYPRPIVALTAHAMSGDRDACLAAGCDEYLTKPIDRDRLIETCREMADRPDREAGRRAA